MLTVLHGGGAASACTVSGLAKFSEYEFFLVPFYKTVEGRPSNAQRSRTLEDVPGMPPLNVEAILLNSTSVYLKWAQPLNRTLNGRLIEFNYVIYIKDPSILRCGSAFFLSRVTFLLMEC